jgi:hypothetical protein
MPAVNLSGLWIGHAFGTHPGPIYAQISQEADGNAEFELKVNSGGNLFEFTGAGVVGETLKAQLTQTGNIDSNVKATLNLQSTTLSQDFIEGLWSSTAPGQGVFRLERYKFAQLPPSQTQAETQPPQPLEVREVELAPVTLSRDDFDQLLVKVGGIVPSNMGIVVTFKTGVHQTSLYASEFMKKTDLPLIPTTVSVLASQPEGQLRKVIIINLGPDANNLRVEWSDRQWVAGASDVLQQFFRERSNRVLGFYRKYHRT